MMYPLGRLSISLLGFWYPAVLLSGASLCGLSNAWTGPPPTPRVHFGPSCCLLVSSSGFLLGSPPPPPFSLPNALVLDFLSLGLDLTSLPCHFRQCLGLSLDWPDMRKAFSSRARL